MRIVIYILTAAATSVLVAIAPALGLGPVALVAGVLLVFLLGYGASVLSNMPAARGGGTAMAPVGTGDAGALPQGLGRALLQRLPTPLLVIGEDGRLTYANPAAQTILRTALPGTHYTTIIRAPAFVDAVEEIIADGRDTGFGFTLLQPQERFFEARAAYLPAGSAAEFGSTAQVIVQFEDRTRDKALLRTRSDFIANASHELRTPLASILGYIETLQGHAKDDPDAQERFLGIMLNQARRMRRLVDDLMSLSRIELSEHVRPETPLDLYRLAAESAAAMFPLASEADVLLQIELDPAAAGPAMILGDRDQLSQVLVNLIDNAIKYGGPGQKVRVCVAAPDPRYPAHWGVSVVDQGPGIARENVPRVTERFFRVSPAKSRDLGGTGLGLAITKHILARHRGALDIQSRQGEGSRFTIWVPRFTQNGVEPENLSETDG